MKGIGIFAIIVLAITLGACGGGSSTTTNPADGAWLEALSSPTGQALGSFTFTITQNGTGLTGTNMNFTGMDSLTPCFGTDAVMSGHMGQGMMNGGAMTMTMSWASPNNAGVNTLTMQGNMGMGMHSGSGTFMLTAGAPGCMSEQGTFTMTHN